MFGSWSWDWTRHSSAAQQAAWEDAAAQNDIEERERKMQLRAKGALSSVTDTDEEEDVQEKEEGDTGDGFAEDDIYDTEGRDSAVVSIEQHSNPALARPNELNRQAPISTSPVAHRWSGNGGGERGAA